MPDFTEKSGRPYLFYLFTIETLKNLSPELDHFGCVDEPLSLMRLMLSRGCNPNTEFLYSTTWELFLLMLLGRDSDRVPLQLLLNELYMKALKILVDFGADPKQEVNQESKIVLSQPRGCERVHEAV